MKKLILFGAVFLVCIINSLAYGDSNFIEDNCSWADNSTYSVIDTFNRPDSSDGGSLQQPSGMNWTDEANTVSITNHTLKIRMGSTIGAGDFAAYTSNNGTIYEFNFNMSECITGGYNSFLVRDASSDSTAQCTTHDCAKVYCYDGASEEYTGHNISTNKSYTFRFEVNVTSRKYTAYMNGTKIWDDKGFVDATADSIDDIAFQRGGELGTFYINSLYLINMSATGGTNRCPQPTYNYSVSYTSIETETESSIFTITFNISDSSFDASNVFSNLIYNNVSYSSTKTILVDTANTIYINFTTTIPIPKVNAFLSTLNFYFNYTFDGSKEQNTSTYNQTIHQMYIDNCGGITNDTTLNITFKDELTSELLSSSFDAYFKIWKGVVGLYREYAFNATNIDTYKFCIYPNSTIYYSDIIIQYKRSGYLTRDWIRTNYSLTNITTFETLFLLSTDNATAVTIHVTDEVDTEIANVLAELWYFDLSTGNYTLVETKLTNTEGEAIFNLVLTNNYYKFKFYQDNDLKKETDKFQITATDLYFQIIEAEATILARWLNINTMSTTLVYSNTSRGLTYSWLTFPGSVSSICWNITAGNGTSFNSDCSTVQNSQFTYTLPNVNASFFIKGYAIDTDNDRWTLDTMTVDLREIWRRIWGTEGTALALVIYLVVSLAVLSSPVSGIIGAVFAFLLIYWFKLIPIGIQWLMGILFLAVLLISTMMRRQRG